jgi:uncharacterized membrane protein YdbT with pleckstrin-like domain
MNTGEAEVAAEDDVEAILPKDILRDDEVVILAIRPSLLFIPLASVSGVMAILILTLALALLAARVPWVPWTDDQAFLLGGLLIITRLGWQSLDWFNRVYVLTDRRIITRSGVLRVSVYETQLKFIQHTTVLRRIRERLFGLGTLGFATAGSGVFDTFWVMIRNPFEVQRIVLEAIQRYGNHRP